MKYQTVIFDLDGTLADTSPGILNCHRYAHRMMGRVEPTEVALRNVIGGPLLQTYRTTFRFSDEEAQRAITYYRQRYEEKGICEAVLYPGMERVLDALKIAGCKIGLASLKAERFIGIMLEHMGIKRYFDAAYGMDDSDSRTKAELIELCMRDLRAEPENTVLVGDSSYDRDGAQSVGIGFIGVTYGFGFREGPGMADTCEQLLKLLT